MTQSEMQGMAKNKSKNTFPKKAIHGSFKDVKFVLNGEIDEIGIKNDSEWRTK